MALYISPVLRYANSIYIYLYVAMSIYIPLYLRIKISRVFIVFSKYIYILFPLLKYVTDVHINTLTASFQMHC